MKNQYKLIINKIKQLKKELKIEFIVRVQQEQENRKNQKGLQTSCLKYYILIVEHHDHLSYFCFWNFLLSFFKSNYFFKFSSKL
jgi:hypothetical protein